MAKSTTKLIIPNEVIENKIFLFRDHKIMIDRDLAVLYNVKTKVLNQAVKRNIKRFPENFMFQLTKKEKEELVTNCDRFNALKHSTSLPYAFTEYGIAMLSSILNSERAVQINIQIINTFIKIRKMVLTHKELKRKIDALGKTVGQHDEEIQVVFDTLKKLIQSTAKQKQKIGFKPHPEYPD